MTKSTAAPPRYRDRAEAGTLLAEILAPLVVGEVCVVLALPRGGVPVAAPVADALAAPLDVLLVRKLGVPEQPELAMGALAGVDGDVEVIRNERVLVRGAVRPDVFSCVVEAEKAELAARLAQYRVRGEPVGGRTVVLVDDGLATGSTMRAALAALRRRAPRRIVVAVPVGAPATCAELAGEVDLLVCPRRPIDFSAVGAAYEDFDQVPDDEVRALLV